MVHPVVRVGFLTLIHIFVPVVLQVENTLKTRRQFWANLLEFFIYDLILFEFFIWLGIFLVFRLILAFVILPNVKISFVLLCWPPIIPIHIGLNRVVLCEVFWAFELWRGSPLLVLSIEWHIFHLINTSSLASQLCQIGLGSLASIEIADDRWEVFHERQSSVILFWSIDTLVILLFATSVTIHHAPDDESLNYPTRAEGSPSARTWTSAFLFWGLWRLLLKSLTEVTCENPPNHIIYLKRLILLLLDAFDSRPFNLKMTNDYTKEHRCHENWV